jgi:hypothetical protein
MKVTIFVLFMGVTLQPIFGQQFRFKAAAGVNSVAHYISSTEFNLFNPGYQFSLYTDVKNGNNRFLEARLSFKSNHAEVRRGFIYPDSIFLPGRPPQLTEKFTAQWLHLYAAYIKQPRVQNSFFYALGAGMQHPLTVSRHTEAREGGFVETYTDKFSFRTGTRTRISASLTAALGHYFYKNKIMVRFNADWSINNWYYPSNVALEKEVRYMVRPWGLSLEAGYVF